ncbi:unnamed protein product [Ophioblennius macclurei]
MQEGKLFSQKTAVAVALCFLFLMLIQQAHAGPVVQRVRPISGFDDANVKGEHAVHALRRIARMTPLWRVMNSKPLGAYCQNNYECSTGLCRVGLCSTGHALQPVKY